MRIFVVEDDEAYSKMLKFRLHQSGFANLRVHNSGEECLEEIHKKPHLVLLDFSLVGLNGLDTLRQIKKKSKKSEVIVLTGLKSEKVAQECFDAGAKDYLQKEENSIVRIINYAKRRNREINARRATITIFVITLIVALIYYLLI